MSIAIAKSHSLQELPEKLPLCPKANTPKFLAEDIGEDVTMPQTKPVEKPLMTREQILALVGSIQDLHDLCLEQNQS